MLICHAGTLKYSLTPPPVAPYRLENVLRSFQATSVNVDPETLPIVVPPQDVTHGSLPGY